MEAQESLEEETLLHVERDVGSELSESLTGKNVRASFTYVVLFESLLLMSMHIETRQIMYFVQLEDAVENEMETFKEQWEGTLKRLFGG